MTVERIVIIILGVLLTGAVTMLISSNSSYGGTEKPGIEADNLVLENEEKEGENEEEVGKEIRHDGGYYSEGYKLFFGDWEITKVIAHHLGYVNYVESVEKFLTGKVITYTKDQFIYDGQSYDNPQYKISIIPIINKNMKYFEWLPLKDLGITGEFFVYVYAKTGDYLPGSEFFIKDDDTLIVVVDDVYMFEMKRLSHVPNVENYYIMV